jgi:hypothetical protein
MLQGNKLQGIDKKQKLHGAVHLSCTYFSLSGLPARVCREWCRKSFQDLPNELAQYRNPKNKAAADTGAFALIQLMLNDTAKNIAPSDTIIVGGWLEKFTVMAGNPRGARNVAKNRPFSQKTIEGYECYYRVHLKNDPMMDLKMADIDESDILEFISRLADHGRAEKTTVKDGDPPSQKVKLAGTPTFEKALKFVRMAFAEYRKTHHRWINPFQNIKPPQGIKKGVSDALPENEVVSLFVPGVLQDTMELAVCAAMSMVPVSGSWL